MLSSIRAYMHDVACMRRMAFDGTSRLRYGVDRLLVAFLDRIWIPGRNSAREVRLKGGASIKYRLNRGDMQSLREVWLEEAYALPSDGVRKVLVDLGANIGLSSLWL